PGGFWLSPSTVSPTTCWPSASVTSSARTGGRRDPPARGRGGTGRLPEPGRPLHGRVRAAAQPAHATVALGGPQCPAVRGVPVTAQQVAWLVLFVLAWGGLALLVAIAIGRTVRDAEQRRPRPPVAPSREGESAPLEVWL